LTYVDIDDQGGFYDRIWGDGTFIYVTATFAGIRSYDNSC